MTKESDNFSGEPLTPDEHRKLRQLLRDEDRMRWLWATLRLWGSWTIASGAAAYAAWEFVIKHVRLQL